MKRSLAIAILFLGGSTQTLQAEQLKVWFTGTVNTIVDTVGEFSGLSIGDPVTGFYIYDLAATDSNADPTVGHYSMPDPANRMSVTVGTTTFDSIPSPQFKIQIFDNNASKDGVIVSSINLAQVENPCWGSLRFVLFDSTETAFSSDALPQELLDLGKFSQKFGFILYFNDCATTPVEVAGLVFDIETMTLTQPVIPTVNTWGLVALSNLITIGATLMLRRHVVMSL